MNSLGIKIKELRIRDGISQKELAQALNIGQTTIANYESDVRQPNLEKLKLLADYFQVSIDELLGRHKVDEGAWPDGIGPLKKKIFVSSETYEEHASRYLSLLLSHKKNEALDFIKNLYDEGCEVTDIYTKIFFTTLHQSGVLWEKGVINVAEEHYITEVTQSLISHLSIAHRGVTHSNRKAFIVNVSGEDHLLAGKMLADFFERSHIETYYLGREVPIRSLIDNLISTGAGLLAISATMYENIDSVKKMIDDIKSHPRLSELKVLVGGQAFEKNPQAWKQVGADATANTFEGAVEKAKTLFGSMGKESENEKG